MDDEGPAADEAVYGGRINECAMCGKRVRDFANPRKKLWPSCDNQVNVGSQVPASELENDYSVRACRSKSYASVERQLFLDSKAVVFKVNSTGPQILCVKKVSGCNSSVDFLHFSRDFVFPVGPQFVFK